MEITVKQLKKAIREQVSLVLKEAVPSPQKKNPALNKTVMDIPPTKPSPKKDPMRQRQMNLPKVEEMAGKDKKTEHSGAKKGRGAYYGKKKDAKKDSNKSRRSQGKKDASSRGYGLEPEYANEGLDLNTGAIIEDAFEDEPKYPVTIGPDVYDVFQRYWRGQSDPLYAVLSRGTEDGVVMATEDEVDVLFDTAQEIIVNPGNSPEADEEEMAAMTFEDDNIDLKRKLYSEDLNTSSVLETALGDDFGAPNY